MSETGRTYSAASLPADIRSTLNQIVVDRIGDTPDSYMRTEDIVGHVAPEQFYRIAPDNLVATKSDPAVAVVHEGTAEPPPHVRLTGRWDGAESVASSNANAFGGLGTLTLDRPGFEIPAADPTPAALGFYGAQLCAVGDVIRFDVDHNQPVTITDFGPDYVARFLHVEGKGSGSFVEFHDPPHLHMPLDEAAWGYLLLGRQAEDDYLLSAFPIPFGQAIYTPPNVLHADPYLVGRYLVVYSVPNTYSTVVFRGPDGGMADVRIG